MEKIEKIEKWEEFYDKLIEEMKTCYYIYHSAAKEYSRGLSPILIFEDWNRVAEQMTLMACNGILRKLLPKVEINAITNLVNSHAEFADNFTTNYKNNLTVICKNIGKNLEEILCECTSRALGMNSVGYGSFSVLFIPEIGTLKEKAKNKSETRHKIQAYSLESDSDKYYQHHFYAYILNAFCSSKSKQGNMIQNFLQMKFSKICEDSAAYEEYYTFVKDLFAYYAPEQPDISGNRFKALAYYNIEKNFNISLIAYILNKKETLKDFEDNVLKSIFLCFFTLDMNPFIVNSELFDSILDEYLKNEKLDYSTRNKGYASSIEYYGSFVRQNAVFTKTISVKLQPYTDYCIKEATSKDLIIENCKKIISQKYEHYGENIKGNLEIMRKSINDERAIKLIKLAFECKEKISKNGFWPKKS